MNIGWICPRCGKVNAPDVKQCDCDNGHYEHTFVPIPYCPQQPYYSPHWYPEVPPTFIVGETHFYG